MEEIENKRRKKYDNIECVQPGFANGVAGDFPLSDEQKQQMVEDMFRGAFFIHENSFCISYFICPIW